PRAAIVRHRSHAEPPTPARLLRSRRSRSGKPERGPPASRRPGPEGRERDESDGQREQPVPPCRGDLLPDHVAQKIREPSKEPGLPSDVPARRREYEQRQGSGRERRRQVQREKVHPSDRQGGQGREPVSIGGLSVLPSESCGRIQFPP